MTKVLRVCTSIPQQQCRTIPRQQCLTSSRWSSQLSSSCCVQCTPCIYIANVLGSNVPVFPGSSAPQSPQVSGLSSAPTCVRVFPDRSACPCPGSNVSRWACHHHQPDDMWHVTFEIWHVTCPRCPGSLWPAALCPSSSAPTCAPMCTGARWQIAWLEKYFLKGVYVLGLYKLRRIGTVWKSMYLCIICFNVNEMKLKYKVHWNIIWFISALQAIKCWYAYFSTFNTRGDHIEPCNCKEHNINKRKNNQILKMKRPSFSVNTINLTSSFLNFLYSL